MNKPIHNEILRASRYFSEYSAHSVGKMTKGNFVTIWLRRLGFSPLAIAIAYKTSIRVIERRQREAVKNYMLKDMQWIEDKISKLYRPSDRPF